MGYQPHDIAWADSPDDNQKTAAYQLIRCPAHGTHSALILSTQILGVKVHFHRGRTTPHLTANCQACLDKSPWRWRGYLACAHPTRLSKFALELTAPCVNAIDEYKRTYKAIRGAMITLSRPSGKANGRIVAEMAPTSTPSGGLPAEFDLQALLLKLWEIQTPNAPNRVDSLIQEYHTNGQEE